ncbi:MAG TPA: DM13 domain-containing protein [Bryobacteraceae bacterium]|nr:DM13 domain-containing protein [Bryobacteraceae bacterium]
MRAKRTNLLVGGILLFSVGVLAWTQLGPREHVMVSGTFHSVAHKGTGEAQVIELPGGSRTLRLPDVKTYPADDLEVCMIGAPDAEDNETVLQAGQVCVGSYSSKRTYAAYPLPARLDLQRYRAVIIWSRRYQVNFTTAPLVQ